MSTHTRAQALRKALHDSPVQGHLTFDRNTHLLLLTIEDTSTGIQYDEPMHLHGWEFVNDTTGAYQGVAYFRNRCTGEAIRAAFTKDTDCF